MDAVMQGMNWVFTLVYLDDIIVFLSTFDDHLRAHRSIVYTIV